MGCSSGAGHQPEQVHETVERSKEPSFAAVVASYSACWIQSMHKSAVDGLDRLDNAGCHDLLQEGKGTV
jgi:hypothetical protein